MATAGKAENYRCELRKVTHTGGIRGMGVKSKRFEAKEVINPTWRVPTMTSAGGQWRRGELGGNTSQLQEVKMLIVWNEVKRDQATAEGVGSGESGGWRSTSESRET